MVPIIVSMINCSNERRKGRAVSPTKKSCVNVKKKNEKEAFHSRKKDKEEKGRMGEKNGVLKKTCS